MRRFYFIIVLFSFFSCKKESNRPSCAKTMASIAGTYTLTKYEEKDAGGVFEDATDIFDPCVLDNRLTLNENGTNAWADVGTVCTPPYVPTGIWSISSSGKITLDDDTSDSEANVVDAVITYNCSALVITASDPVSPGDQVRVTFTRVN